MEGKITPGWRTPNLRGTASRVTAEPTMRASVGENAKSATNEDIRPNSAEREALKQTIFNRKEPIKQLPKAKRKETGERAKEPLSLQIQTPEEKARKKKVIQKMILQ